MKVLITAATTFELSALEAHLKKHFIQAEPHRYQRGEIQVALLITGVGLPLTAYAMGKVIGADEWDLAINAGIAGSLDRELPPGTVVQVVSERFADLGVEEADGGFTSVHELGLVESEQPPFEADGRIVNKGAAEFSFLPTVHGISVNRVHGYEPSIQALRQRYPNAQLESMEGAAFFYACALERVPFLQIRAVSNWVEARDRERWEVELALERLNTTLIELIQSLFA